MNKKRIIVIMGIVLIVIAAVLVLLIQMNKPETVEGAKTITLTVIFADESTKEFTIHTDEEFLRGALEQEGLVAGEESQYGLFVTAVCGVEVDSTKNEWWCFNDGEGNMLNTGIDMTPIADGDAFQAVLSTY